MAVLPSTVESGPKRAWLHVAKRAAREIARDDVTLIAAGLAFYGLLSLFPMLIAVVMVWGLVADPIEIERQVREVAVALPPTVQRLVAEQLHEIASKPPRTLSLGALVSVAGAVWSSSKGSSALIRGIGIAYGDVEARTMVKQQALSLVISLGFVVSVVASVALLAVLPWLLDLLPLGEASRTILWLGRWPLLAFLFAMGVAVVYRLAPRNKHGRVNWFSWGSGVATAIWIVASIGLTLYAQYFGSFNKTYGSLTGVVVLLLWMWISAIAVLVGAELNHEIDQYRAGLSRPN